MANEQSDRGFSMAEETGGSGDGQQDSGANNGQQGAGRGGRATGTEQAAGAADDRSLPPRRGLSIRNLDDVVATLIVVSYLGLAVAMMGGWGDWSRLPDTFQYWTTSAFIVALTLIFGKGVNEYRRGLH